MQFLLIEDDEVDAEAFSRGFRQYLPYALHVVSDGETALTLLRGHEKKKPLQWPYVIILDLDLPRLPGLNFLQALRLDPKLRRSVVFVLTASDYAVNQSNAYQYGIAGFIRKDKLITASQSVFTLFRVYCELNTFG